MHFCLLHKIKGCILVFFDILQQLCNEKGIAISALLDEIGMSRGNMARWKAGLEPKAATKKKIADVLGVNISELEEKPAAPKDSELDALLKDELIAFYGEVKENLDQNDIDDLKTFMRMKAEIKKNREKK